MAHFLKTEPEKKILALLLFAVASLLIFIFGLWIGGWIFMLILSVVMFQKPGRISGWIAHILGGFLKHQKRYKK